ncbi:SprT family zinc-dependent metalloprotease [Streptomyces sp. JHA26]|uniref:M48 family metallopeptidase n=1 Tax=Streptomyces sp. JHA26 TaxID=1917143 RepID=UPI00098B7000
MIGERCQFSYGSHVVEFTIVRRDRKTLEISVEPDRTVVVAAPQTVSVDAVIQRVRKRARWILRQQDYFAQFTPRTPERRFLSGETHLYLGRQYRLKVVQDSTECVKLVGGHFVVRTDFPSRPDVTKSLLNDWYQTKAQVKFEERLEATLSRFPDPISVRPSMLSVRPLRLRWGSMNAAAHLVLNRRLVQAPIDSIDYVIAHELCHVAVLNHGAEFLKFLDRVMPDWAKRKERLERCLA